MNITRKDIDSLNAILTVQILEEDYAGAVDSTLKNYRKTANVPGFRKGHVPMGMIKKQYGKSVMLDEVNSLVQKSLNDYLVEEKLELLGQPLPINQENIDWDAKEFSLDFELGLSPKFEIDLKKLDVTHYNIIVSDKMAEEQVEQIRKQYGKLISKEEVSEGDELTGVFEAKEAGIEQEVTISLEELKRKTDIKKLVGKKVGDSVSLKTKNLFVDGKDAAIRYLGVSAEIAETLDVEVDFTIEEINARELATLDQDLFDKIFGKDVVKSKEEFIGKIKEDGEKQFEQQSNQKLLDDVVDNLIENTKFDLPSEFLQRWIQASAEEKMTTEQAIEEFNRSEKGLRYQLIEANLTNEHKLSPDFEELKAFAGEMIKMQMAQFGQMNPKKEDIDPIVMRILRNEEEVQRLHQQLVTNKLLDFFKEKLDLKTKEVDFEEFVKEAYGA